MDGILVTNGDDWEALYIGGLLYIQDHKISISAIRRVKGELYKQEISYDYTAKVGYLPDDYEDIPKDAFLGKPELVE